MSNGAIGGAPGKTFTISNSIDVAKANCSGGKLVIGTYEKDAQELPVEMFGGETDQFWVINAGGTVVLIAVNDNAESRQDVLPVVHGISFDGASAVAHTTPNGLAFDHAFDAQWNLVSIAYPAGWAVTPAQRPWYSDTSGLEGYDAVNATNGRFIVASRRLPTTGLGHVLPAEWLSTYRPEDSCQTPASREPITPLGLSGYLLSSNCGNALGPFPTTVWSRAIAAREGRAFVFQMDTDGLGRYGVARRFHGEPDRIAGVAVSPVSSPSGLSPCGL